MIGGISASSQHVLLDPRQPKAPAEKPQQPEAPPVPPPPPQTEEKVPGVLRLLAQGHFKGVADVRLRINFAEEIQQQQLRQQQASAPQEVTELTGQIASAFAPYVTDAQASEELPADLPADDPATPTLNDALDQFTAAATAAAEAFAGGTDASLDDLRDSLQAAFADLVDKTQPLMMQAPTPVPAPGSDVGSDAETPEAPAEAILEAPTEAPQQPEETSDELAEVVSGDEQLPAAEPEPPVEESQDPVADFYTALQQSFDAALAQMLQDLSQVRALPPLTQPSGQGGAYAKFLAIYESMQAPVDAAPSDIAVA